MNQKVCVFLADGFEEIEGLTVVDILRRGQVETETVSVMGRLEIQGSHGIEIKADRLFEEMSFDDAAMLVLPGGIPGTPNLQEHPGLTGLLKQFYEEEKYLAAICAAPRIFGGLGFLKDRPACCHPSQEDVLYSKEVSKDKVVVSGHIITSRGMGTAIEFGLTLLELLTDKTTAEHVKNGIVYF
ncbi:MAG: DJ-1/PfpI family protein [Hespellia sp.]|nr:DJ-1/PfpI family protein [Hespellia sp.]